LSRATQLTAMVRTGRARPPQVVLITGASRGIGAACARLLAQRGHRVFGTSRQAGAPGPSPTALGRGSLEMIPMDVDSEASVRAGVEHVLERAGRLDVAVNNAAIGILGPVEDTSVEEARAQFETNLLGVWRVCRAALPPMRRQGGGLIVNMGSLGGVVGIPFQAAYSASKFGLEGLTESLRLEVRPFGIRVVIIEPGSIDTEATARSPHTAARTAAYDEQLERAERAMIRGERDGARPEAVARLLGRILGTSRPRVRYTVGPVPERAAASMKRVLPSRLFERILIQANGLSARPRRGPTAPVDGTVVGGGTGVES
jgi:NAD(P)-dependent dehydrogenase (short-subunit alcohol dehydrogenase family)